MNTMRRMRRNEETTLNSKLVHVLPQLLSALCGIGFVSLFLSLSGCSGQPSEGGHFSMPPMPVEVARAEARSIEDRFEAIGSIEANDAITVVSEIDATVTSLPFKEGSIIRKGELIARLDDAQRAAEVSRAEALDEQSHGNYARVKAIVDQQAGSPQDLDDAAAAMKVADANLALARAQLAKTRITAPFDGIVGARRISMGTFLRAGQPITELANIQSMRVNFSAPERYLAQLKQGSEVGVSTIAYAGETLKGDIIAIDPVLDPGTRTARVVARVNNAGGKLRPGMSADVFAVLGRRLNAVTIPNEAVFANGNQSFVYAVSADSTAARVPVALGTRLADVVEVVHGLAAGQVVVRAGHQKLFDGARVMPVGVQTAAAGR